MRKIVSALLAAMLLVSMFASTALAGLGYPKNYGANGNDSCNADWAYNGGGQASNGCYGGKNK